MYQAPHPLPGEQGDLPAEGPGKGSSPGQTPPSLPSMPQLCEDGQPYVTDPLTGRQICLCGLGLGLGLEHPLAGRLPLVNRSSLNLKTLSQLPSVSTTPGLGFDPSTLYSPLIRALPIQPGRPSPSPLLTPGLVGGHSFPVETGLAASPYGFFYPTMEIGNTALGRAATRETTGPLKEWLGQHKKNPYPTKAEKIMLAIITKMTLTQVSTWFANARRRLKKENKTGVKGQSSTDQNEDDDVMSDDQGNDDACGEQDNDYDSIPTTLGDVTGGNRETMSPHDGPSSSACVDSDAEEINVDSSDPENETRDLFQDEVRGSMSHQSHEPFSLNLKEAVSLSHLSRQLPFHPSDILGRLQDPTSLQSRDYYHHYRHSGSFTPLPTSSSTLVSQLWNSTTTKAREAGTIGHEDETSKPPNTTASTTTETPDNKPSTMTATRKSKSKIWSISEIINEKSSTSSPTNDDNPQNDAIGEYVSGMSVPLPSRLQLAGIPVSPSPHHPSNDGLQLAGIPASPSPHHPSNDEPSMLSPSPSSPSMSPESKSHPQSRSTQSSPLLIPPTFRPTSSHSRLKARSPLSPFSLSTSSRVDAETLLRLHRYSASAGSLSRRYKKYAKISNHDSKISSPHPSISNGMVLPNGLTVSGRQSYPPNVCLFQNHPEREHRSKHSPQRSTSRNVSTFGHHEVVDKNVGTDCFKSGDRLLSSHRDIFPDECPHAKIKLKAEQEGPLPHSHNSFNDLRSMKTKSSHQQTDCDGFSPRLSPSSHDDDRNWLMRKDSVAVVRKSCDYNDPGKRSRRPSSDFDTEVRLSSFGNSPSYDKDDARVAVRNSGPDQFMHEKEAVDLSV